jgi:hypothetical protein
MLLFISTGPWNMFRFLPTSFGCGEIHGAEPVLGLAPEQLQF